MRFEKITTTMLQQAIELYLHIAYDDVNERQKHQPNFSAATTLREILTNFIDEGTAELPAWSLRLGSRFYPHTKLILHRSYLPNEYVFTVDRHDCFRFTAPADDVKKWEQLQARNYALKKAIEAEWYQHDLPTLRAVKEEFLSVSTRLQTKQHGKILIVDNDEDALAIFDMILTQAGYRCWAARGVSEAEKLLDDHEQHFVATVIDLLLADGVGQTIIAKIRSDERTKNLPSIILSGLAEDQIENRVAFDGYLRKPFAANDLVAEIKRVINLYYDGE